MIKSLLYYIALLLFVIYNCNTPFTFIRKFIPSSVGKYLLGFPAFIVVTTILVVYPILTGKELMTFDTDSATTNIFKPDTANSVNRSALVIDDSGEIILEKNASINQNFSDLVTSLRTDIQNLNSKVNNNTNVLKAQTENFVNNTNTSLVNMNNHFARAANKNSAITPAPPDGEVQCHHGAPSTVNGLQMCKRKNAVGSDAWKNQFHHDHHGLKHCPSFSGAAWLTTNKNNSSEGHYACIRGGNGRIMFHSAVGRGQTSISFPTLDFNGIQIN